MAWQQRTGTEGHVFHLAFPNSAGGAVRARKEFITFVKGFCLDRQFVTDIELVVGEALANAVEHGYKPRGTIIVDACVAEDALEAAVTDDGSGFTLHGPISREFPVANSPRGYGLFLMQTLVDQLEIRNAGRTVWFRKRFGAGRA